MYRPQDPFNSTAELFETSTEVVKGVTLKKRKFLGLINCSFKTYGGTDQVVNGLYSVVDTAEVITWYRPDITSSCGIKINDKYYEIIGTPENIDMRNQYIKFKVKAITGGV